LTSVVTTGPVTVVGGQKFIITACVAADNGTVGSSGQLEMDITLDGASIVNTPIINSIDTSGTGASCSFTVSTSPSAGSHTFAVRAAATGDATLSVAVSHASIHVLRVVV